MSEAAFRRAFRCQMATVGRGKTLDASVPRYLLRVLMIYMIALLVFMAAAFAEESPADRAIQEKVWAIPLHCQQSPMWFAPSATTRFRSW